MLKDRLAPLQVERKNLKDEIKQRILANKILKWKRKR